MGTLWFWLLALQRRTQGAAPPIPHQGREADEQVSATRRCHAPQNLPAAAAATQVRALARSPAHTSIIAPL